MRIILLASLLTAVIARGADEPGMREKLHAKIMASAPPPVVIKPAGDSPPATVAPVVVMTPLVVSGSTVVREVSIVLARAEEYRVAEKFTPLRGGTLYTGQAFQLGSWWTPAEGWTFFRRNKRPGPRQVEDTAARMRELEELMTIEKKK